MIRTDNRTPDALRPHSITTDFVPTADGSCLIQTGGTRVICTASVEESVPPFLKGRGEGWVTAEYAMLPASCGKRKARDGVKKDGRGVEISRLIGRALRGCVDRKSLGERTITVDCDVLTADGGTRTAAITGGFVALCLAVDKLMRGGKILSSPITTQICAVSAGIVQGTPCLDLCYVEDSAADTDMNFVMNGKGDFLELQGTGEGRAFSKDEFLALLSLGEKGCRELLALQKTALGEAARRIGQQTLVLASNNQGKLSELKGLLGDEFNVLSMKEAGFFEEIEENGQTFEQNACLKAEAVAHATKCMTLADDSGLAVDALGGAPGVYSARYGGEHGNDQKNNALLIANLAEFPRPWTAKFVCAMALAVPGSPTRTVRGEVQGEIIPDARGEMGFGYDPHFLYENGLTFAQMGEGEKNTLSHRARAMAQMKEVLKKI